MQIGSEFPIHFSGDGPRSLWLRVSECSQVTKKHSIACLSDKLRQSLKIQDTGRYSQTSLKRTRDEGKPQFKVYESG